MIIAIYNACAGYLSGLGIALLELGKKIVGG